MDKKNVCPECGGEVVARHGRFGWFYGCSNYPRCKFTANYDDFDFDFNINIWRDDEIGRIAQGVWQESLNGG